jgi:hypothetical protein
LVSQNCSKFNKNSSSQLDTEKNFNDRQNCLMDYLGSSQSDQFNKTEMNPKIKNRTEADVISERRTEGELEMISFNSKQNSLQRCISELQLAIKEKDERILTL